MAENLIPVRVVFRPGPAQTAAPFADYAISEAELQRIVDDSSSTTTNPNRLRMYTVYRSTDHAPIKLIVRLADILYIG